MLAKSIAKEQWLGYSDRPSPSVGDQDIAIEIRGSFPLLRVQGKRLRRIGITYNAANNALEITTAPFIT